MQQFSNEIVLAYNRIVLVKTKKSERILKSSLEMELIGLADYLDIRRQRERIKNGCQIAGLSKMGR